MLQQQAEDLRKLWSKIVELWRKTLTFMNREIPVESKLFEHIYRWSGWAGMIPLAPLLGLVLHLCGVSKPTVTSWMFAALFIQVALMGTNLLFFFAKQKHYRRQRDFYKIQANRLRELQALAEKSKEN